MFFDLDISPYSYFVKFRNSGYIDRILVDEVEIAPNLKGFQVLTYLNPNLNICKPNYAIYSQAEGTGSDTNKYLAYKKSFSEAIERWAFSKLNEIGEARSSSGFAAFPSLLGTKAILNSKYEAIERYALLLFNYGKIGLTHFKENAFIGYFSRYKFVLVSFNGAYGFACHRDENVALQSALVEMKRNLRALKGYGHIIPTNMQEKRIKFFSTEKGKNKFNHLVEVSLSRSPQNTFPDVLTSEVRGEWNQFAKVYRSEVVSALKDPGILDFFYF